jgi:hypothetical protein
LQAINEDLFRTYVDDFGSDIVEIHWTPPQSEFLQSTCTYPLFVGGFGCGKTTTMAGAMYDDLIRYPGAWIAGYAPTYDLLTLVTIPAVLEFLDAMDMPHDHNKSRYLIDVHDYGRFIFRSLDTPKRIVGYRTLRAHIDEIDTLPRKKAEDAWNKVIARNRQKLRLPGGGGYAKNRVSAYTTPEGFSFCYDRWVKKQSPGYQMFKASTRSNPHLPEDYVDNLIATYPANLIEAYVEGEFVNLTSGAVYPMFDRELNGCDTEVQGNEPLDVGMDFNVIKGAAGIHVRRGKEVHCVDQIYNAYDTDAQIAYLKQKYPHNPITIYPDASGDSRSSSNTTESDIAKLKAAKFRVKMPNANPLIKNRVASFNAMICNGEGVRRYKVNIKNAPNVVETLEQQVYDDNGMPDKKSNLDHIGDACGYFIDYEFGISKPKATVTTIEGGY